MGNTILPLMSSVQTEKLKESENVWQPSHKIENRKETEIEKLHKKVHGILNKLTAKNFEILVEQLKNMNVSTEEELCEVIHVIYEQFINEHMFRGQYANLCKHLALISIPLDGQQGQYPFRNLLLRKWKLEFKQSTNGKLKIVNEITRSFFIVERCKDYLEKCKKLERNFKKRGKKLQMRCIGNIIFLSELFKLNMIIVPSMNECLKELISEKEDEFLECFCQILKRMDKDLENKLSSSCTDKYYFDMQYIIFRRLVSPRICFTLQDVIDFKLHNWGFKRDINNLLSFDSLASIHATRKNALRASISGNETKVTATEVEKQIPITTEIIKLHESEKIWHSLYKKENTNYQNNSDIEKFCRIVRQVRSILNKITFRNFKTLVQQMIKLDITTKNELNGVIHVIFEYFIKEPVYRVLYAYICRNLVPISLPLDGQLGRFQFRRCLLTKCQIEFEQSTNSNLQQKKIIIAIEETDVEKSKNEKKLKQMRSNGTVIFISELFKLNMLNESIMHECLQELLAKGDDGSLESFCHMLEKIGKHLEDKTPTSTNEYFPAIQNIINRRMSHLHIRFMLQDVVDLRNNNWIPRSIAAMEKNASRQSHGKKKKKVKNTQEIKRHKKKKKAKNTQKIKQKNTNITEKGIKLHESENASHPSKNIKRIKQKNTNITEEDIKLHESENAWHPSHKKNNTAHEDHDIEKLNKKFQQTKSILNKLTTQNFKSLVQQMINLDISTQNELTGVVHVIFEQFIKEPVYRVLYAKLCMHLVSIGVPLDGEPGQFQFKKCLLKKCQFEFGQTIKSNLQRKKRIKAVEEVHAEKCKDLQMKIQNEEKNIQMRNIGNVIFISELFKLNMIIEPILHKCLQKLIEQGDDESLECFCHMLERTGKDLENKTPTSTDQYFRRIQNIINRRMVCPRIHLMLQDVIDLRHKSWVSKSDKSNSKTVESFLPAPALSKDVSGKSHGMNKKVKIKKAIIEKTIPATKTKNIQLEKSKKVWLPSHKKKKDAGKITEFEKLRKQVHCILNKMTAQNFEILTKHVENLNIITEGRIIQVVNILVKKFIEEPIFIELYAKICQRLSLTCMLLNGTSGHNRFKQLLIKKCQMEFEKENNDLQRIEKIKNINADDIQKLGELQMEFEEKERKIWKRISGNTVFISELYKLNMVYEHIIHEYIQKLLSQGDDKCLDCLCNMFKRIGKELDQIKKKIPQNSGTPIDRYLTDIQKITFRRFTSYKILFKLQEVIELRQNNWVSKREETYPKILDCFI